MELTDYPPRLIKEMELFGRNGITVTPSFVLGIPGETEISLQQNKDLIERIGSLGNVHEMEVNMLKVFPGSRFFRRSMGNAEIINRYYSETGTDLTTADDIDCNQLSTVFVDTLNDVSSHQIMETIRSLYKELKPIVTIFSFDNLKNV